MIKFLIEFVLITIVVFFVWNILKRIFFNSFYKFSKPPQEKKENSSEKLKAGKHGLNWDAETVDYEEVKEKKGDPEQDQKKN